MNDLWLVVVALAIVQTLACIAIYLSTVRNGIKIDAVHSLCNSRLENLRSELVISDAAAVGLQQQAASQSDLVVNLRAEIASLNGIAIDLHKQIAILRVGMESQKQLTDPQSEPMRI